MLTSHHVALVELHLYPKGFWLFHNYLYGHPRLTEWCLEWNWQCQVVWLPNSKNEKNICLIRTVCSATIEISSNSRVLFYKTHRTLPSTLSRGTALHKECWKYLPENMTKHKSTCSKKTAYIKSEIHWW